MADFYILDARSCVGNCALWWGPNRGGYTCELFKAGLYTLEEAKSHRETDIPVHKSIAENRVVKHVRWEALKDAGVGIYKAQRGCRPEIVESEPSRGANICVKAIQAGEARVAELEKSNEIASDRMQILCREKAELEELLQEADAGTNKLTKKLEDERESHGKLNMGLRTENRGLRTEVENARAAVERVVLLEAQLATSQDEREGYRQHFLAAREAMAVKDKVAAKAIQAGEARVRELEADNRDMRQCMRFVGADLAPGRGPREMAELVKARVAELEGRTTNCPECGKVQKGRLKVLRSRPPSARCQHCGFVAQTRSRGVDMLRPDQSGEGKSDGK